MTQHLIACLHWGRPHRWLGRWHERVWVCPYCKSLWHTILVPAGFGESAWLWEELPERPIFTDD